MRDLEIALVLAREMKAAAERSVDASLRLDQLQEVFGVAQLDSAGRARIQTALQMAGLEPQPSLLEADPEEPIRFGANKVPVAAAATSAGAPPPRAAAAPPEEPQTFPTVGQFARSTLRTRRFGARRGDHGDEPAPPPPVEPPAATNGHVPEEAEVEPEPVPEHELLEEEVAEPDVAEEHVTYEQAEEPAYAEMPAPEPVVYAEPLPQPEPAAARPEEVVAVLLPAVAIPVLVTAVAGWRFGLPFVALTVVATGWILGRRSAGFLETLRRSAGARTGLKVTGIVTLLSIAACVGLVAVRGSSTTSKKAAAPAPPTASQTAVTKPPAKHKHRHHARAAKKHHARHHAHRAVAVAPKPVTPVKPVTPPSTTTPAAPPGDPATQGLVRVPPSPTSGTARR